MRLIRLYSHLVPVVDVWRVEQDGFCGQMLARLYVATPYNERDCIVRGTVQSLGSYSQKEYTVRGAIQ